MASPRTTTNARSNNLLDYVSTHVSVMVRVVSKLLHLVFVLMLAFVPSPGNCYRGMAQHKECPDESPPERGQRGVRSPGLGE